MNWLNSLMRKPPPPAPARAAPKRAAAPRPPVAAPDTGALREALAGALEPAARGRQEAALGHALGASLQSPAATDAPGVWIAAISHSADKTVALAWLEQLSGAEALAQIACQGRYAEVRLAAAQRITDSATLESVARASKNKDKGVYRHCADLLRGRRDHQERLQRAAAIAENLRRLLERAPLSVSHLLEVEREWKALDAPPAHREGGAVQHPEPLPAAVAEGVLIDCRALLDQANARVLEEADAQRALHALAAGHDELAAQMAGAGFPGAAQLADWHAQQARLVAGVQALPAWLAASGTATVLGAGLQSLGARLAAWAQDRERVAALEDFLAAHAGGTPLAAAAGAASDATGDASSDAGGDASGAIAEAAAHEGAAAQAAPVDAAVQARWAALPKPEDPEALRPLLERWEALQATPAPVAAPVAAAPEAPAPEKVAEPPIDLDALRAELENLEQALEGGQLAQADAAARHIKAALGSRSLEDRMDARLQRALARLGELRGWAQWGATKKREDLIDAAEQLRGGVAAGTHDVEHLAVAIPALREEWKRLNTQGTAGKGQWEKFDRALEQAYVPVAAFHAEESERRGQARALREALLVQWEAALAAIDWAHPDPAAIDAQRESMLAQWRGAPHAGYRDERLMRARFDTLVRTLDQNADAARAAEVARREALIAAVTALAEVADPRVAGNRAKELQEQWRSGASAMRLRRGEEQKLWQRFRAACDVVFARREAERAALTTQRQERQQARVALLDGFAALLADAAAGHAPAGGADAVRRALAQFRADWEAGSATAGDSAAQAGSQERQARDLQRQAQQCVVQLQRDAVHARYAALAQATPAGAIEGADLAQGGAQRDELLIDLEIALGLATPGASAELRRRRQLEQLQNRFRPGAAAAPREQDPDKLLARCYAIAAAPDPLRDERIAAVVRALIERELAALTRREAEAAREPRSGARPGPRAGPRPEARSTARPRR